MWRPDLEFLLPSNNSWQRNDQQKRTIDVMWIHQNRQKWDRLNSFAKTHFVSQYDAILSECITEIVLTAYIAILYKNVSKLT